MYLQTKTQYIGVIKVMMPVEYTIIIVEAEDGYLKYAENTENKFNKDHYKYLNKYVIRKI